MIFRKAIISCFITAFCLVLPARQATGADRLTLATTITTGHPYGVAVSGNYAYVTYDYDSGSYHGRLKLYDISNPASDALRGFIAHRDYFLADVIVSGTRAYVADTFIGGRVFEVSDKSSPKELGKSDLEEAWTTSIFLSGNYLYGLGNMTEPRSSTFQTLRSPL